MELFPAIDLRDGKAVRLLQGDYDRETIYGDDPVEIAAGFAAAGAPWIHVVDLDAARRGDPVNRPVIAAIARAVAGQSQVQTGGGVRSAADAEVLSTLGVARAVMGSAAVREPALVAAASGYLPIAVGLDHRDGEVAVHGWTEGSGQRLDDLLGAFPTAAALVITNIAVDGMLTGPDLDGLRSAAETSTVPIVASGGIASIADLIALAEIPNIVGAITGKALYERRFTVSEALEALR